MKFLIREIEERDKANMVLQWPHHRDSEQQDAPHSFLYVSQWKAAANSKVKKVEVHCPIANFKNANWQLLLNQEQDLIVNPKHLTKAKLDIADEILIAEQKNKLQLDEVLILPPFHEDPRSYNIPFANKISIVLILPVSGKKDMQLGDPWQYLSPRKNPVHYLCVRPAVSSKWFMTPTRNPNSESPLSLLRLAMYKYLTVSFRYRYDRCHFSATPPDTHVMFVQATTEGLRPLQSANTEMHASNNSELSSHQKKIFKVDDHIGVAIAGLTADGYTYESPLPAGRHRRVLSRYMRFEFGENFKSNRSLDRQPEHTTHQYLRRVELAKRELAEIEKQEIENRKIKEYINQLESRASERSSIPNLDVCVFSHSSRRIPEMKHFTGEFPLQMLGYLIAMFKHNQIYIFVVRYGKSDG
ncbi:hypothetical protein LXL04_038168 [Taraxacum kok-saghyz]